MGCGSFQLPSISESPPEKPGPTYLSSMEALNSSQERLGKEGVNSAAKDWIPPAIPTSSEKAINGSTAAESDKNVEHEPLMQNPEKTDTKLNLSSGKHENGDGDKDNGEKEFYQEGFLLHGPEESVQEALLAVFFSIFHLVWSIGIGFWHLKDGSLEAGYLTLAVVIASGIVTEMTYFFNGKLKKGKIWSSSKILSLLFLIPITLPTFVSLGNLVYAIKESKDANYIRPWTHSRIIFLVESLTLIVPQCVLQTVLLMEEVDNFPSLKGSVIAGGLLVFTGGLTFARIRYDSAKKFDRFSVGTEKYIRYAVVWACKVLWLVTHCCLIVSVRVMFGKENILAPILATLALQLIYEIPLLLSSIEAFRKMHGFLLGSFFLLPQFAALISLIVWVNVDTTVYLYNIGSCVLGMFFGAECLCILGWLLNRCTGRENDCIPNYPHIFGNVYIRMNK
ncbi:unnamed protein product [Allacma fusca]|uniref:XK-related protein n=1 Tax=Allacma fusca TaxID=39272 RepID=A0A8J2J198_9HEXA|nr:unnamed protein product [Allacma fusca]